MKHRVLIPLSAAALCWAGAAIADEIKGEVLAHDRVARVIVLNDKSVLSYKADTPLPDDLKQGDQVEIEYTGSEGDISVIISIQRVGG
jgi:hypothetical protein